MSIKNEVSAKTFGSKIKQSVIAEWNSFKVPSIWIGLVVGGVMQYVHNVAHNYVYYLAGKYGVSGGPANELVDLGFKALVPSIENLSFLPSNGCLYTLGAIGVIVAVSPFFTRMIVRAPDVRVVHIFWRALVTCSICIIFRCVSFLVTILPAPAPHCSVDEFNPPQTASDIFFRFDTEDGCSDLIFSSHMMYGITAACIVTQYVFTAKHLMQSVTERRLKYALVILCWCTVIAEGFCIVAQHRHYTIDVWNALYAVPLVWIAFYHFVPNDPKPKEEIARRESNETNNLEAVASV